MTTHHTSETDDQEKGSALESESAATSAAPQKAEESGADTQKPVSQQSAGLPTENGQDDQAIVTKKKRKNKEDKKGKGDRESKGGRGEGWESGENQEEGDGRHLHSPDYQGVKAGGDSSVGSKRGVETMFRNVFRAELDLITLAATKANIMISLNGFIVSALMISGAFIYASSPVFLVPASVFMFTAAVSIVFALLAASPERADMPGALYLWIKDVIRRRARLSDFRSRVIHQRERFVDDKANVLIYKDRAKLSREEYWNLMEKLIEDRPQIYKKMSDQLYWLGLITNRKFHYLNISYFIFRWGLLASVLAFVCVRSMPAFFILDGPGFAATNGKPVSNSVGNAAITAEMRDLGVDAFKSTYEPSAVQQLQDGRLLVVEDEPARAFNILGIAQDGSLVEDEALDARLLRTFKRKLSDVEALTLDNEGYVYASTSHTPNKDGERKADRELMMRFKIVGNEIRELGYYSDLLNALTSDENLQKMIEGAIGSGVDFSTTNIEGIAYDKKKDRLLLGFREPVVNDKTMIIAIANPKDVFTDKAAPQFSETIFLDMQGGGIRGFTYDAVKDIYLITNEVVGDNGKYRSQVWTWNGDPTSKPQPMTVPGLQYLKNVESVDSIVINGKAYLIFMSDEGSESKQKMGKYMKVDRDSMEW